MNGQEGIVNPVQVQKFLDGIDYPVSKDEILSYAKKMGADENVLSTLQKLPEGVYNNPVDISEAIGRLE